jgi:hypothetical protein
VGDKMKGKKVIQIEQKFINRIDELLVKGDTLLSHHSVSDEYPAYGVDHHLIPEVQAWIYSVANLIQLIVPPGRFFLEALNQLTTHEYLHTGASWTIVQKIRGLLASLKEEIAHGLLSKLEYMLVATTFDDFLDHAQEFHKANKKIESGVLAAIVLWKIR